MFNCTICQTYPAHWFRNKGVFVIRISPWLVKIFVNVASVKNISLNSIPQTVIKISTHHRDVWYFPPHIFPAYNDIPYPKYWFSIFYNGNHDHGRGKIINVYWRVITDHYALYLLSYQVETVHWQCILTSCQNQTI